MAQQNLQPPVEAVSRQKQMNGDAERDSNWKAKPMVIQSTVTGQNRQPVTRQ